jgi:hypothetical protein
VLSDDMRGAVDGEQDVTGVEMLDIFERVQSGLEDALIGYTSVQNRRTGMFHTKHRDEGSL